MRIPALPEASHAKRTALFAIAAQLEVLEAVRQTKHPSFCDALRHVLHLLRRARPGGGLFFFAGLFRAGVVFALLLFAAAAVAALALRFAPRDPAMSTSLSFS